MQPPVTVVYLTRVRLPSFSPQGIQVLATAHALARAGADVYLFADRPGGGDIPGARMATGERAPEGRRDARHDSGGKGTMQPGVPPSSRSLLHSHGLTPHVRLHLSWLTTSHRTRAGLEYRARVRTALRQAVRRDSLPILFSRRVDYAAAFLRHRACFPRATRLVHEWHYVDSANALEAGRRRDAYAWARLERVVMAGADGHLAISARLGDFLSRRASLEPLRVVPNGGPEPASRQRDRAEVLARGRWPARPARVVYAGLFRRPNDLRALLEAVRHLPSSVEVVVVGGDDGRHRLREVMGMAGRMGLLIRPCLQGSLEAPASRSAGNATTGGDHASLCFAGPMTPRETRTVFEQADVGVASFEDSINMRWFACPLKILEYHAAGLALASSDHPTVRALVEDGRSGLLVPPGDGPGMARAIMRLLETPGLARDLAKEGLRRAATRTWVHRGEELLATFRTIGTLAHGSRFP